jgi:WD40 repeat protein
MVNLKTHYKMVRSLSFIEDGTKILSSSDDYSVKLIDINSETITHTFEGHKQAVPRVVAHPTDNKLAFSCSFDKTVKCWDLRMNNCIGTAVTGSPLWSCAVYGNHVAAGG